MAYESESDHGDNDDDDDDACEESWFLYYEGRKDVVVAIKDENDRPNDCNHCSNDTDISKAKGKTKAKDNVTTTKAKTKTNAKDDKKKPTAGSRPPHQTRPPPLHPRKPASMPGRKRRRQSTNIHPAAPTFTVTTSVHESSTANDRPPQLQLQQ
jgi:hypothetical protein